MAALVSTFESASRFEGTDESSAQATISINIVALSCRTFSLVRLLIDYAFGVAICIAYGDPNGGNVSGCDGARSAVKSGGCCAAKTTPPNKTGALRVLKHPVTPAMSVWWKLTDHRAPFAQRKRRPWSIDTDWRGHRPSKCWFSWDIVQNLIFWQKSFV